MARSVGRRTRNDGNRSSPLKWAFALMALAMMAGAAGVSVFYFNPVGIGMLLARQGLDRSGLERQWVEAPRGRMIYWAGGVGEPVVLLHGMGNQAGSWAKMAADVAVMSRVILPDLPRHGDRDPVAGSLTLDDLVDGVFKLAAAGPGVAGPINLGNPEEMSILEFAEIVRELTGKPADIRFLPMPEDDPVRRCPDIARAERELGWRPTTPLRTGLAKTIDYFENVLAAGRAEATS